MNNNTILRIKVPAHLYESVKNQLTLKEGKSSKSFGDWTVVKEKKTSDSGSKKEIKQTPKKVEEADGVDQQDRFADLGGNGIYSIIKFLLDDGFDIEDIIEKIKGHFSEEETDSDEELEEGVQDLKENISGTQPITVDAKTLVDFYQRVKQMEAEGTDIESAVEYAVFDINNKDTPEDLKEYEVIYVYENGQCYRKDDEGNKTKVDRSKCR
jgi:hypothetical protein